MNQPNISIPAEDLRKLLAAAAPDSALLYLYLLGNGDLSQAEFNLRLPRMRLDMALASLRQMGLYDDTRPAFIKGEPPAYTQEEVTRELSTSQDFTRLVGEIQRRFGRILSAEELKVLLSFVDYLELPPTVISVLITYCIQRNAAKGNRRAPSLRAMEKTAYHWAEQGINTLEEAASFVQNQLERQNQLAILACELQIQGRKLTAGEERYLLSWLDWGFGKVEIAMAYEKTVLNLGSMKWPYCNSILKSWREQGLLTADQISAGDKRPAPKPKVPMGSAATAPLSDLDRKVIEDMKREMEAMAT